MTKKIRSGLWRCRSGFFVDGKPIKAGTRVPDDLPYSVMDHREGNFVRRVPAEAPAGPFTAAADDEPVVEQATAAPGEKRTTSRTRKSKAAKPDGDGVRDPE